MRLKAGDVSAPLNQTASVVRKEVTCKMSTASRAIHNGKYSVRSRFTTRIGTNAEKLVAAALCSCFSRALIRALELSGFRAEHSETTATLILTRLGDGW